MTVTPEFGCWLAGLIDGEGSFGSTVPRAAGGFGVCPRFHMRLRLDDRPLLDEITQTTHIGYVDEDHSPREGNGNPTARWLVVSKANCRGLVILLDRYPLRSKKARDYAVWRLMVHEWQAVRPRYGKNGRLPHDWTRMRALAAQLVAGRRYVAPVPRHVAGQHPEFVGSPPHE
jgi:hypothetical protein